jgi:phospholipase D1/2
MSLFKDAKHTLHGIKDTVKSGFGALEDKFQAEIHSHTHMGETCLRLHRHERDNRFLSFAPPRTGNDVKWFVDGCGYFWAVSVAIEQAKESICESGAQSSYPGLLRARLH